MSEEADWRQRLAASKRVSDVSATYIHPKHVYLVRETVSRRGRDWIVRSGFEGTDGV